MMRLEPGKRSAEKASRLSIRLAQSQADVEAAQRLRWQVFAEEQGARLTSPVDGLDIDALDAHCDHLIVTDVGRERVVGTYRLLTASAAERCGGYYSASEFDISGLLAGGRRVLEIGRSCVHPDYRTGAIIALLWSGLAAYLVRSRHDALIGCASIGLRGQEAGGAALARGLARLQPIPDELRVHPRRELPFAAEPDAVPTEVPPLIKGYLRSGAIVCGEPCWDPDFYCADVFLYLAAETMDPRYARRFLAPATVEH